VLDDGGWPLRTANPVRMPARVARTARVDDALLAPGAQVAGVVERCVLAPGVVVEEGAEVRDSVLLHDVVVRRGARVTGAILDEGCVVGHGAAVGGDADGGRCVAVVGRRVRVDDGAIVARGAQLDAADAPTEEDAA
jgi:glucose-1-phosphate adenylyltransferase